MALTSDSSYITRGFIKSFFDRLKNIFATKENALIGGRSIEINGTETSTNNNGAWISGEQLYVDIDISAVKINTTSTVGIKFVIPKFGWSGSTSGDNTFYNGFKIDIIGNWYPMVSGSQSQFTICYGSYTYQPDAQYMTYNLYNSTKTGVFTNEHGGIFFSSSGSDSHEYNIDTDLTKSFYSGNIHAKAQLMFWNGYWYGDKPQITLTTSKASFYNTTFKNIPVNSEAIYNLYNENTPDASGNNSAFFTVGSTAYYGLKPAISYLYNQMYSADLSNVVHYTGAETISGQKTFTTTDIHTAGITVKTSDTTGCKMQYNATDKCLDFIF